jgi:hypothetical protein
MLKNGVEAWSMSLSEHVQEAVKNVKNYLQEKEPGRPWLTKAPMPFVKDCRPEIDLLPELGPMTHPDACLRLACCVGWFSPEEWMSSLRCQCWHPS